MQERNIDNQLLNSYSNDINKFLKPIYASRNIYENELNLSLNNLLKPNFNDLNIALKILEQAIINQQNIVIIGDFDADGATSCALSIKALKSMGANNVDFLVPNRFKHGYGLSCSIVEIAKNKKKANVIITVDNGISSNDGVNLAKQYNIKVIITDHHLPNKKLPNADAIINPNLKDCDFPSKNLAGVGVSFYLFSSLKSYLKQKNYFIKKNIEEPDMRLLLDLVALGTIADVVPLDRNNKIMVSYGLKLIRDKKCSMGIIALLQIAKRQIKFTTSNDLGFSVAPRLNASGRLDDISRGVKCLLSIDYNDAYAYALELDEFNKQRKLKQEQTIINAEEIIAEQNLNDSNFAISLFNKNWHEGIIGIVAGKIKEIYNCPVVVFASSSKNELKGSARSITSVHIKDLFDNIDKKNPNLILKFGGHAMAAGLLIKKQNLKKFKNIFIEEVKAHLKNKLPNSEFLTDGIIAIEDMTLQNAKLLNSHTWGNGFEEPIFYANFEIIEQKVMAEKHLKLRLKIQEKVFDGVAFFTDKILKKNIIMAYKLTINNYMNQEILQLISVKIE